MGYAWKLGKKLMTKPGGAVIVFVFVLLGLAAAGIELATAAQSSQTAAAAQSAGGGITLTTDKAAYRAGEPIRLTLEVFNNASEPVTFQFKSSQRYDFIIEDGKKEQVWRWSASRMFAMVLGSETLGPGNPRLSYQETCSEMLAPGAYFITGLLTDSNQSLSATTRVIVQ